MIAEVKRASPSKGLIAHEWDPELITKTCANNGAAAISCLTDGRFFQGELEYLTAIKSVCAPAVKPCGAPQGLYLPRIPGVRSAHGRGRRHSAHRRTLGDNDLRRLRELAASLGMAALVEVHDEAEEDAPYKTGAGIIGVNNRNLNTFAVDLETTTHLHAS